MTAIFTGVVCSVLAIVSINFSTSETIPNDWKDDEIRLRQRTSRYSAFRAALPQAQPLEVALVCISRASPCIQSNNHQQLTRLMLPWIYRAAPCGVRDIDSCLRAASSIKCDHPIVTCEDQFATTNEKAGIILIAGKYMQTGLHVV